MKIKSSTLAEVLIAILIISIITISVYYFFRGFNKYLFRLDFNNKTLNIVKKISTNFSYATNYTNNNFNISIKTNNTNEILIDFKSVKFNRIYTKKIYYIKVK